MEFNHDVLKKIISFSDLGYALCEIIFNEEGRPVDFRLIDANRSFLGIFDIKDFKAEFIFGKTVFGDSEQILDPMTILTSCLYMASKKENGYFDVFFKNSSKGYRINLLNDNNSFILFFNKAHAINKYLYDKYQLSDLIISSINDIIFILNLDFTFTFVTPSVYNVLGFKTEDLIGKNLKEIASKANYLIFKEQLEQAITENWESNWLFEVAQHHIDGAEKVIEYDVQLLRDNQQKVLGVMALGRDITQWMEAKIETKRSKDRFALLLNSTAEGILGLNKEGFITFANQSSLKLLGYEDHRELVGKHINRIMGIDIDEIFHERFVDVLNQNGIHNEIDQFAKANGSHFVAEYYIYPKKNNDEIVGYVLTFFDITNRVKTENELYEAERSKEVIIKNLPGLAYRCDYDDFYTFRYVSGGCFDLTGYTPESLVNNKDIPFLETIIPRYRNDIRIILDEILGTNQIYKLEYEIICADGSTKWVLDQGQFIYGERGEVIALEGIIIDINELKVKQAEIEYLSFFDSLTGLRNRLSFEITREKMFKEEYFPLTLIIGDINGLKLVNDTLGHDAGDKILIQTAKLLTEVIGSDYLISRTSGDEFQILLPNTSYEAAYIKMKDILAYIAKYNMTVSSELEKINLALGYATMESLQDDFITAKKVAEDYMYKRKMNDKLSYHSSVIASIRTTMFERSQMTEEHADRMKEYSSIIGHALNLSQIELDELSLVSTLHDIGKVGIDDRILNKPGKLTKEEWAEMKRHPEIGYRICMSSPDLISIAPFILMHHERWDGTGYPAGIKGENIPLIARIISIVDAYDAMIEDRPYRKALLPEAALLEIEKNAGTQFDPNLAKIFVKIMKKRN